MVSDACFLALLFTEKFQSPFDRKADYTGVEKELLAMHADRIFWKVFHGTREEDLHLMFRKRKPKEYRSSSNKEEKNTVKAFGSQYFAALLLGRDWKELCSLPINELNRLFADGPEIPWRRIYDHYIVPLAKLTRAMHASYSTQERDPVVLDLARDYTRGCREILGVDFMITRGIWHRLFHMLHQTAGKLLVEPL